MTGYTFGRHGHDFEHLGPIVAEDGETARRLAATCLGAHAGRPFVVDVPLGQQSWQQSLEALGFRYQRPLIRMARGTGDIPGDPSRQFAVLGPGVRVTKTRQIPTHQLPEARARLAGVRWSCDGGSASCSSI